jgi:hypothetical protein
MSACPVLKVYGDDLLEKHARMNSISSPLAIRPAPGRLLTCSRGASGPCRPGPAAFPTPGRAPRDGRARGPDDRGSGRAGPDRRAIPRVQALVAGAGGPRDPGHAPERLSFFVLRARCGGPATPPGQRVRALRAAPAPRRFSGAARVGQVGRAATGGRAKVIARAAETAAGAASRSI